MDEIDKKNDMEKPFIKKEGKNNTSLHRDHLLEQA
jgi:hypothetical protein